MVFLPGHPNTESEFCAGYVDGGTGACYGDDGAPLVCVVKSQPVLYGVFSGFSGSQVCGSDDAPNIFVKTPFFRKLHFQNSGYFFPNE